MKLYLNGKKITQKAAKAQVGEARFKAMVKEAKAAFREDPHEEISWWIGSGILVFDFEFDC